MKRERKQDTLWSFLFCGTQMALFERGLGQSSSKRPKKHGLFLFLLNLYDFICSMEQKYFWRMKIWRHIIRDLKTAVLNRGLKIMTAVLWTNQLTYLIWYIEYILFKMQFFLVFRMTTFHFWVNYALKYLA